MYCVYNIITNIVIGFCVIYYSWLSVTQILITKKKSKTHKTDFCTIKSERKIFALETLCKYIEDNEGMDRFYLNQSAVYKIVLRLMY